MADLCELADRTGKRVELTPMSDFGGSKRRLVEFYKRFGFVQNHGLNRDLEISEDMYRLPQNPQPEHDRRADVEPEKQAITERLDRLQRPRRPEPPGLSS